MDERKNGLREKQVDTEKHVEANRTNGEQPRAISSRQREEELNDMAFTSRYPKLKKKYLSEQKPLED